MKIKLLSTNFVHPRSVEEGTFPSHVHGTITEGLELLGSTRQSTRVVQAQVSALRSTVSRGWQIKSDRKDMVVLVWKAFDLDNSLH